MITIESEEKCSRHLDRPAEFAASLAYVYQEGWRNILRSSEMLDGICSECRIDLIHWLHEEQT